MGLIRSRIAKVFLLLFSKKQTCPLLLSRLDVAVTPEEMDLPGFYFHALKGERAGTYSVCVTANWRLTFRWEGQDAVALDLEDYH